MFALLFSVSSRHWQTSNFTRNTVVEVTGLVNSFLVVLGVDPRAWHMLS
jgi:hypothetical protein